MIQLAEPLGLLALASLPVIVALHVLRPRRRTVQVPATGLWREALSERQRGLGLQRLLRSLSLLLLLLAALAASLALAAPEWRVPSDDGEDVVLVVDASASMKARSGAGTRFDDALRQARAVVDAVPAGARVLVMTSARRAVLRSGFEYDSARVRRVLAALAPTDEAGRPAEALALALSLLGNRERARVVFVTDGALDPAVDPGTPRIEYRLVGAPARNVAITRFDFRAERGADDRFEVLLTVRNYIGEPVAVPVEVTLERRVLLRRSLDLAANGEQTLVLPFRGKALGRASARIDVADDHAADDRAFAVVNVPEPLRVLLAGPGNVYLESVLAASPRLDLTRTAALAPEDLDRLAAAYDVVVVDRLALPRLPPGNFLLLDALAPDLPFSGDARIAQPVVEGVGLSVLTEGIDLTGVRIDEARRVARPVETPGLQRLLWSEDTELALALLEPGRRLVYLGFDVAQSNLPLQAAFPLFVARCLDWLRTGDDASVGDAAPTAVAAGEPVLLRASGAREDIVIRTPKGEGLALRLEDGALTFEDTAVAGIYRYSVGEVARYFAVNVADPAESDLRRRLTDDRSPPPAPTTATAVVVEPLWPALAMTAAVLLMLEWLVWCGGRRRA